MYTPQQLKLTLSIFATLSEGMVSLLPSNTNKDMKNILSTLSRALVEDWFVELLTFTLNTFESGQPNRGQLAKALHYFAERVELIGLAPPLKMEQGE